MTDMTSMRSGKMHINKLTMAKNQDEINVDDLNSNSTTLSPVALDMLSGDHGENPNFKK